MKNISIVLVLFCCYIISNTAASTIHARGIFDPLVSAVDSLFGISTADSTQNAVSTADQTSPPSTEIQTTAIATPVATTAAPETQAPPITSTFQVPVSTELQSTTPIAPQPTITEASSALQSPTEDTTSIESPFATILPAPSSLSATSVSTTSLFTPVSSTTSATLVTPTASNRGTQPTPANPLHGLPSSSPVPSHSDTDAKSQVSKAGTAVAIIAAILLLAGIVYLIIRFNPRVNAKYAQWRKSLKGEHTEEDIMNDEKKHDKFDDFEKPVFGKAVVINIASPPTAHTPHSKASDDVPLSTKSPACGSCHKLRRSRFSFQFFNPPSPKDTQLPQTVKRKPVPAPLNFQQSNPSNFQPVGLAVPLGPSAKQHAAFPLSPRSWLARKRVSYYEDYSGVVRK